MTSNESYTTEEIANLLKISKLTVYDLIKKGELPSYRVGKQMRIDASDLEAYKQRAKGKANGGKADRAEPVISAPANIQPIANRCRRLQHCRGKKSFSGREYST